MNDALNKLKFSVLSKTGYIEVSTDQDYDEKKKKFETNKKYCKETLKHIKTLHSHFSAISTTFSLLSNDLKAVYGENDPMTGVTQEFNKIVEEIENKHLKLYETQLTEKCMNPLTLLNNEDTLKLMEKRDKAKNGL